MPDEKKGEIADGKLKRKDYERELERLHVEFVKLQQWVVHKGLKVCICFEGRDGAGKGGTIKALTERVSPRVFRVVALAAPSDREKSQMYMQRYVGHLPAAGAQGKKREVYVALCRAYPPRARGGVLLAQRVQTRGRVVRAGILYRG